MVGIVTVQETENLPERWQEKLWLATKYINPPPKMEDEFTDGFGMLHDDNTSHQCPGWYLYGTAQEENSDGICLPCPDDKPLWWIVLRWFKVLLLKLARSYHGKPILLLVAPLCVGIAIGFYLGCRYGTSINDQTSQQPSSSSSSSPTSSADNSDGKSRQLFPKSVSLIRYFASFLQFFGWFSTMVAEFKSPPEIRKKYEKTNHFDQAETTKYQSITTTEKYDSSATPDGGVGVSVSDTADELEGRENRVRSNLRSDEGTHRESGVDIAHVPQHIAVIMDGNRRYGRAKYGNISRGHWDGCSKLVEFAKWCIAEHIPCLTVYAFSTENWNREPAEVSALMTIFATYCNELREEALKKNIRVYVLSTDFGRFPANVQEGLTRMVEETKTCDGLKMNICMSYGSRSEIVHASRNLIVDVMENKISLESIDENEFEKRLLTNHQCIDDDDDDDNCNDYNKINNNPDVLLRTSGEIRISNFLLWQLAYTEMFFIEKSWPEIEKADLLSIIRSYAKGRTRRYGR